MSETFRPGGADDVDAAISLMRHSFPAQGREMDWWRAYVTDGAHDGAEALWMAEEDGRPTACCQLLRVRQHVGGGRAVPCMGLAAVAVAPTHRRRGLAARMLTAGLRHARARGDLVSALYPFRVTFYEGLGWGLAGEAHQYRLEPAAFPDDPAGRARVRLAEGAEGIAAVRAVYDAWAPGQPGQLARPDRFWREPWWGGADRPVGVYHDADGRPTGYCALRYRSDLPPHERWLEVEERAWLTEDARRGLLAWIASLGDQWREVLYRAHPDEGLEALVREPRLPRGSAPAWQNWFASAVLVRGPMFRLLDVPRAWAERALADAPPLTVRLEVEDAQLPENRGPWRLRLADGRADAVPDDGGPVDAVLATSVMTLSRLYLGELPPSRAWSAGALRVDRPEVLPALDLALRQTRPWTFDRF